MDAVSATLIGVGITAFVSVCAIWVNYLTTRRSLQHSAAREFGKISLELKIRQLNELYGPLMLLLEQNRRLAEKLREGKAGTEEWRLLDNLPSILENPRDKAIVEEIIEIDTKIEDLIINRAGLIRAPGPPRSFDLFVGHFKALKLAIEGKERPRIAEFEYYPRELNEDVRKEYQAILHERDELLRKYEHQLI